MILLAMWRKKRISLQIHILVREEGLIAAEKCKNEIVTFFHMLQSTKMEKMRCQFSCQKGSASHHRSLTDRKTMYFVLPRKPLPTACPQLPAVSSIFSFQMFHIQQLDTIATWHILKTSYCNMCAFGDCWPYANNRRLERHDQRLLWHHCLLQQANIRHDVLMSIPCHQTSQRTL